MPLWAYVPLVAFALVLAVGPIAPAMRLGSISKSP